MAISFDAASNSAVQTISNPYSWSHVCTGSNLFLAVDVEMLSVPGTTVTGITYNGVAMSFIGARSTVSGAGRVECWGLIAPATGSNTIAVTLSASCTSISTAASYAGVNQSTATEGFTSNQATNGGAADATLTITTTTDKCWDHVACVADDDAITPGQTSRNNVSSSLVGSGTNEDSNSEITPAGGSAFFYTDVGAGKTWAIAGYGILPVAAPVPPLAKSVIVRQAAARASFY